MAAVDLTAAPTGAAIVPKPIANPRPASAGGFADALAEAQGAIPASSDHDDSGTAPAANAAVAAPAPVEGGPRLPTWMALAWMAPSADTHVAPAADETSSRDDEPVDEPVEAGTGNAADHGGGIAPSPVVTVAVPVEQTAQVDTPPVSQGNGEPAIADTLPSRTGASSVSSEAGTSPGVTKRSARGATAQTVSAAAPNASAPESSPEPLRPSDLRPSAAEVILAGDGAPGSAAQASAESRPTAPEDSRAKTPVPRSAAFARAVLGRFGPAESGELTPSASPQQRSWVDTVEVARPATAARRESAFAMSVMPVPTAPPTTSLAPASAVQAPQATPGIDAEAADALQSHIIHTMRLQHQGNGGDARIRLQPHYLGELTVSLRVEQGAVTAHLAASQPDVRQWIEANESMLRQHLAQHDLTLERLTVAEEDAPESPRQGGEADGRREAPPKPRRRRQDTDATFEVVV